MVVFAEGRSPSGKKKKKKREREGGLCGAVTVAGWGKRYLQPDEQVARGLICGS